jgi:hypothetical protein
MQPTGRLVTKDPDATKWTKGIDWTDYLAERSTTISSSTWVISPSGLTNAADRIVTGSVKTEIDLSGGTPGVTYTVTNRITTAAGATDDRSFFVLVEDR